MCSWNRETIPEFLVLKPLSISTRGVYIFCGLIKMRSYVTLLRISRLYYERHLAWKASMPQQDERKQLCSSDSSLYDRLAASIFAYVRLHTSSLEDAEDLTLEIFLTALEHDNLSWLTEKQQFVWLRRVAHNKLVDSYRRPTSPPAVPLEQVVE